MQHLKVDLTTATDSDSGAISFTTATSLFADARHAAAAARDERAKAEALVQDPELVAAARHGAELRVANDKIAGELDTAARLILVDALAECFSGAMPGELAQLSKLPDGRIEIRIDLSAETAGHVNLAVRLSRQLTQSSGWHLAGTDPENPQPYCLVGYVKPHLKVSVA